MAIHIKKSHKGLLHKDLGVKQGEPIPASKLKVKSSDSAAVKKRKVFAQNAKKWHHGEDGLEITPIQKPLPSINDMVSPDKLTRNSGSLTLPPEHQQQGHGVNWNPFLVGLNAIDALIPGQKSHLPVVQPSMSYNDHPYGTGSQAIMLNGGDVPKGHWNRVQFMDDGGALAKKNAKKVSDVPSGYNFAGEESGRKYYNRQSAGVIPMAIGGGKPGKDYDSFLQKQLQSGISPDELVQKKYISPDEIGKYKQFYKPIQDYIYTEQGQQQAPVPQDNPAAAFHGEPIFMHTGVTNKAIGMAKYPARNTNTMSQQGNLNTGNQDVQFMYMDKMGKPVQDSGIYHIPFDEWNNRGQASNFADSSFINKYSPRRGMKYGGYMDDGGNVKKTREEANAHIYFPFPTANDKREGNTQFTSDSAGYVAGYRSMHPIDQVYPLGFELKSPFQSGYYDHMLDRGLPTPKMLPSFPVRKGENGLQMLDDNTIEFKGPSHENGGIPISYSGNKAEVEGGETGYMSPVDNSLHVMGNMTNPLTGKKFKEDSKVLANKENRVQKTMTNGASLLQEADPMDKYDMFKFNSGKAMLQGGMAKQKEISQSKEWLATLQKAMLDTANEHNLDPQKFSKGKQLPKYDDGGKVPISRIKTRGPMELPTMFSSGPMANATVTHNRIHPLDAGSIAQTPTVFSHDYNAPPSQLNDSPSLQLPDINGNDTTSSATDNGNPLGGYGGNNSFSNAQGLGLGQILPELYTLATNKQEPVWMQQYNPQMYSPYKVSFQDRRNSNTSTFDALKQAYNNNPAALSSLAGNLYDANNGVNADEFRTNQGIQNDITNKNTQLLNEAQTTNLKLADDQYVRQAQAKANTKQQNRVVLQSISDKVHQNMLEQKTIGLYENLYPDFRFDPNSMKSIYEGDPNQANYIQWPTSGSVMSNSNTIPSDEKVVTKTDANGNTKGQTITKNPQALSRRQSSLATISEVQANKAKVNAFRNIFQKKR